MKEEFLIFFVFSASFSIFVECRAVSRECHDKFHNCQMWRRSGFCGANSHAYYLKNACAKTCGFCKSNNPVNSNLHSVQDALQEVRKISAGDATVGAMHRLHAPPQVTHQHKALDDAEEKPDCTDRFVTQRCADWKNGEICMDERYRKYLTYGCAMTCRFCNCRDTYRESPYCDEWKSRGFCETYKDQLDTYCPKTCGFCVNAKYEETTAPSQNATAPTEPSQNATTKSLDQKGESPSAEMKVVKSHNHPTEFVESGNTNTKRGFPEQNSPLWSVNGDTRLTLPQPQQYDDMGGASRRPLEDGTYFTPAKASDKFEYYTEHYSPDPYVAAAQREEWMTVNTGNGVAPSPSLSRKSKSPKKKAEKETITVLKKSKIRHAKHAHQKKN